MVFKGLLLAVAKGRLVFYIIGGIEVFSVAQRVGRLVQPFFRSSVRANLHKSIQPRF